MNPDKVPDNQKRDEKGITKLIIWMLPAIALPIIAQDIGGGIPSIVMSMLLGAIGAVIGFTLFWLTKDKGNSIRYGTFGLMLIATIGIMIFQANRAESVQENLITCQICGYKTLEKQGSECKVCVAQINDNFKDAEGYISIDQLIKEEQLYFFSQEDGITFNKPETYEYLDLEYLKDERWKPIVTSEEVEMIRKEMDEIGKHIEVELEKVQ